MKGTDHAFSLEPDGMRKLVRDLDRARIALGTGIKETYPSELAPLVKMGKKIIATKNILKGAIILESDLAYKSPGDGVSPSQSEVIIGRTALREIVAGEPLRLSDVN